MEAVVPPQSTQCDSECRGSRWRSCSTLGKREDRSDFFFPTKNISDTGDGNLKIKGLLSICGQGYTLTSAGCWILMGFWDRDGVRIQVALWTKGFLSILQENESRQSACDSPTCTRGYLPLQAWVLAIASMSYWTTQNFVIIVGFDLVIFKIAIKDLMSY